MPQYIHNPMPKQWDFINSTKSEVLYSGAFAAGKTRALCFKLVIRASKKGAREGLCRKELISLKRSTLKTLLEGDGGLPPVLPLGTYTHNANAGEIKIKGGGEILYFGLDDYEKISSYNLSGCAVDEGATVSLKDWEMLLGRLRLNVGLPLQIYSACNPAGPNHWMAKRFGIVNGQPEIEGEAFEVITTSTLDNKYLPAEYIKSMKRKKGTEYQRNVLGLWVGSDKQVYDCFGDHNIIKRMPSGDPELVIAGLDVGFTNPTAICILNKYGQDKYVIAYEHEQSKLTSTDIITLCKDFSVKFSIDMFVIDPSAAALIEEFRREGISVIEAENSLDNISTVRDWLDSGKLKVHHNCKKTIDQFRTYEYEMDNDGFATDKPVKAHDHLMDATRYAVTYCFMNNLSVFTL